jgi:hypothetical protein
VTYHFRYNRNEPDYLLDTDEFQAVAEAKYKFEGGKTQDVRQVCGYTRLKEVVEHFRVPCNEVINGIIFYYDPANGFESLHGVDLLGCPIRGFVKLYKVGIKMPVH